MSDDPNHVPRAVESFPVDSGEEELRADVMGLLNEILQAVDSEANAEGEETTAQDVKGPQKKDGFILCDLCNNIVNGSVPEHLAEEHADIALLVGARSEAARAKTSSQTPSSEAAVLDSKIGTYAYATVSAADRGKEMFDVIIKATDQMRFITQSPSSDAVLYLFGSCVTMGLWDGLGDADYTLFTPGRADAETGEPPRRVQQDIIQELTKKLRNGGFQFNELEPVMQARVPVICRKRDAKRPHELRPSQEPYVLQFTFKDVGARDAFIRQSAKALTSVYGAKLLPLDTPKTTLVTCAVGDGINAIRLYSRREKDFVSTKRWKLHSRLPEIFSVDFDLSCRPLGIRNSWFLRAYMEQDPVTRAGNLFIKQWSKLAGVNNSRAGFLTSYAVTNLWVFYLLRTGQATFVDPEKFPRLPSDKAYGSPTYMPLWPYAAEDKAKLATLGAAIRGFFRFYAEEFDWDNEVVSLRRSGPTTKADLGWNADSEVDEIILRNRIFYRVCIEDVYEENLNLGRHLSPTKADWLHTQFRLAWACCSSGSSSADGSEMFTALLQDGYLKRAQATLHVAVWRHLILHGGAATVGEIKRMLRASHAEALSNYEMFHRISDLWYDADTLDDDRANNDHHRRRNVEVTPEPQLASSDDWAAVCCPRLFPSAASNDRDDRIVFLANADIFPNGGRDVSDKEVEAAFVRAAPLFSAAAATVRDGVANSPGASTEPSPGSPHKGGSTKHEVSPPSSPSTQCFTPPMDLRSAPPLAARAFFTVDGLAFPTYHARDTFVRHLAVLAECLSSPEIAERIADSLRGAHRSAGASVVVPIVAAYYGESVGADVNEAAVSFIFAQKQYVRRHAETGNPDATDLLRAHRLQSGNEEDTKRVKKVAPPKAPHRSGGRAPPARMPIRRDTEKGVVGRCSECGKMGATTYPTNQPDVDPGRYCMVCWSAY